MFLPRMESIMPPWGWAGWLGAGVATRLRNSPGRTPSAEEGADSMGAATDGCIAELRAASSEAGPNPALTGAGWDWEGIGAVAPVAAPAG